LAAAYTTSGVVVNPKVWIGSVSSTTTGTFSATISSASFAAVISVSAIVVDNTNTAIDGQVLWLTTASTTTITGQLVMGTTVGALGGASLVNDTVARTVYLVVWGQ
jgi:hypothetical protein